MKSQAGGLVVDTVIRNNLAPATGYTKYGGGVNVSGGLMTRCVITNNVTTYVTSSMGGGAYVSGGTLENSFVCGNETDKKADGKTPVYYDLSTVCDRNGVHVFLRAKDPDARKVEAGLQFRHRHRDVLRAGC